MQDNSLKIITPYYPSEGNEAGGIFIYDTLGPLSTHYKDIEVLVLLPLIFLSRKPPFLSFKRKYWKLRKPHIHNVRIKAVFYLPFPKDTFVHHLSIAFSLYFFRKRLNQSPVLAHTIYPIGVALTRLLHGASCSIMIHGTDLRYFIKNHKISGHIISAINSNRIICVSNGLKKEIIALNGVVNPNISVVANGVHFDSHFTPKHVLTDRFQFIYVGGLLETKGVFDLIRAFAIVLKSLPQCILNIIGSGPSEDELRDLAVELCGNKVRFAGKQSPDKAIEFMRESQCLVLPSHFEGFGRVLIESMSVGNPVISTYSGGPEYIINPEVGSLVQPKDAKALAGAMKTMYENYGRYNPLAIFNYAKTHYDISVQTEKLVSIIDNA